MTKDKPPSQPLSDEDVALWQRVAGTTKPLKKRSHRLVKAPEGSAEQRPQSSSGPKARASLRPAQPMRASQPAAPPPLGHYDRGEARALASGRLDIEARIDLHGMRQREAHTALKGFIHRCRSRGQRHVLVITGKGRGAGSEPGERGVLNREVPRWLNEPEFRQFVVGYTTAHKRHGGEGALYVRLRRNRPEG